MRGSSQLTTTGGGSIATAKLVQSLLARYEGSLRGTGPITGPVVIRDGGVLFPGSDVTSALPVATLTIDYGTVELGFSAGNATHASVTASGAVQVNTGLLKLDFASTPAAGTVFTGLITAPGTIGGCFTQAQAVPNVVIEPQCTSNAVSATVQPSTASSLADSTTTDAVLVSYFARPNSLRSHSSIMRLS